MRYLLFIIIGYCCSYRAAFGEVSDDLCILPTGNFPNPDDCTSFIRCNNGVAEEETCPDGLLFNPFLITCDYSRTGKCTKEEDFKKATPPSETEDIGCPEDGPNIFSIPSSCPEYYLCVGDIAYRAQCPEDLLFNPDKMTCDIADDTSCDITSTNDILPPHTRMIATIEDGELDAEEIGGTTSMPTDTTSGNIFSSSKIQSTETPIQDATTSETEFQKDLSTSGDPSSDVSSFSLSSSASESSTADNMKEETTQSATSVSAFEFESTTNKSPTEMISSEKTEDGRNDESETTSDTFSELTKSTETSVESIVTTEYATTINDQATSPDTTSPYPDSTVFDYTSTQTLPNTLQTQESDATEIEENTGGSTEGNSDSWMNNSETSHETPTVTEKTTDTASDKILSSIDYKSSSAESSRADQSSLQTTEESHNEKKTSETTNSDSQLIFTESTTELNSQTEILETTLTETTRSSSVTELSSSLSEEYLTDSMVANSTSESLSVTETSRNTRTSFSEPGTNSENNEITSASITSDFEKTSEQYTESESTKASPSTPTMETLMSSVPPTSSSRDTLTTTPVYSTSETIPAKETNSEGTSVENTSTFNTEKTTESTETEDISETSNISKSTNTESNGRQTEQTGVTTVAFSEYEGGSTTIADVITRQTSTAVTTENPGLDITSENTGLLTKSTQSSVETSIFNETTEILVSTSSQEIKSTYLSTGSDSYVSEITTNSEILPDVTSEITDKEIITDDIKSTVEQGNITTLSPIEVSTETSPVTVDTSVSTVSGVTDIIFQTTPEDNTPDTKITDESFSEYTKSANFSSETSSETSTKITSTQNLPKETSESSTMSESEQTPTAEQTILTPENTEINEKSTSKFSLITDTSELEVRPTDLTTVQEKLTEITTNLNGNVTETNAEFSEIPTSTAPSSTDVSAFSPTTSAITSSEIEEMISTKTSDNSETSRRTEQLSTDFPSVASKISPEMTETYEDTTNGMTFSTETPGTKEITTDFFPPETTEVTLTDTSHFPKTSDPKETAEFSLLTSGITSDTTEVFGTTAETTVPETSPPTQSSTDFPTSLTSKSYDNVTNDIRTLTEVPPTLYPTATDLSSSDISVASTTENIRLSTSNEKQTSDGSASYETTTEETSTEVSLAGTSGTSSSGFPLTTAKSSTVSEIDEIITTGTSGKEETGSTDISSETPHINENLTTETEKNVITSISTTDEIFSEKISNEYEDSTADTPVSTKTTTISEIITNFPTAPDISITNISENGTTDNKELSTVTSTTFELSTRIISLNDSIITDISDFPDTTQSDKETSSDLSNSTEFSTEFKDNNFTNDPGLTTAPETLTSTDHSSRMATEMTPTTNKNVVSTTSETVQSLSTEPENTPDIATETSKVSETEITSVSDRSTPVSSVFTDTSSGDKSSSTSLSSTTELPSRITEERETVADEISTSETNVNTEKHTDLPKTTNSHVTTPTTEEAFTDSSVTFESTTRIHDITEISSDSNTLRTVSPVSESISTTSTITDTSRTDLPYTEQSSTTNLFSVTPDMQNITTEKVLIISEATEHQTDSQTTSSSSYDGTSKADELSSTQLPSTIKLSSEITNTREATTDGIPTVKISYPLTDLPITSTKVYYDTTTKRSNESETPITEPSSTVFVTPVTSALTDTPGTDLPSTKLSSATELYSGTPKVHVTTEDISTYSETTVTTKQPTGPQITSNSYDDTTVHTVTIGKSTDSSASYKSTKVSDDITTKISSDSQTSETDKFTASENIISEIPIVTDTSVDISSTTVFSEVTGVPEVITKKFSITDTVTEQQTDLPIASNSFEDITDEASTTSETFHTTSSKEISTTKVSTTSFSEVTDIHEITTEIAHTIATKQQTDLPTSSNSFKDVTTDSSTPAEEFTTGNSVSYESSTKGTSTVSDEISEKTSPYPETLETSTFAYFSTTTSEPSSNMYNNTSDATEVMHSIGIASTSDISESTSRTYENITDASISESEQTNTPPTSSKAALITTTNTPEILISETFPRDDLVTGSDEHTTVNTNDFFSFDELTTVSETSIPVTTVSYEVPTSTSRKPSEKQTTTETTNVNLVTTEGENISTRPNIEEYTSSQETVSESLTDQDLSRDPRIDLTSSTTDITSTDNSVCITPNGFYPNSDDCTSFYQCKKGVPVPSYCPDNFHFSPVKKVCQDPCEALCDLNLDCPTSSTKANPDSTTTQLPETPSSGTQPQLSSTSELGTTTYTASTTAATDDMKISNNTSYTTSETTVSMISTTRLSDATSVATSEITDGYTTGETTITSDDLSTIYTDDEMLETSTSDSVASEITTVSTTEYGSTSETGLPKDSTIGISTETSIATETSTLEILSTGSSGGTENPSESYSSSTVSSTVISDVPRSTSEKPQIDCEDPEDCYSTEDPKISTHIPFGICRRNDFIPSRKCNKFINCTGTVPRMKKCAQGLHFNPTSRVCDWPFKAGCGDIAEPLYETDDSFSCPCRSCIIPSSENCEEYYLCLGFTAYHMKCSNNLLFDPELNTCTYAHDVDCPITTVSTISTDIISTEKVTTTSTTESTTVTSTTKRPATSTRKSTTAPTSKPKNFVCPRSNGLFKHPDNCGKFIQCSNWRPYRMSCPASLHFNVEKLVCDYPCNAKCDLTLRCGSTTEAPNDPRCPCRTCKLPSEDTCTKYIQCTNGIPRIVNCPYGQTFDSKRNTCDWANRVQCQHSEICPRRNGLFPHKEDCHKFVHCSNGIPYIKNCPYILEFDTAKQRCEWPNGRCKPSISVKEADILKTEEHRDGWKCPKTFGYFTDEQHCNKFYYCSLGTPSLKECADGLSYNPKIQNCDWAKHVRCDSHRHHNPKKCRVYDRHVTCPKSRTPLPHTHCSMYYDCSAGAACAKRCPIGLYFNKTTGLCDQPANVKCFHPTQEQYSLKDISLSCAAGDRRKMVDPADKACFYHCRHGNVISGCCSKGHIYNEHRDRCDSLARTLNIRDVSESSDSSSDNSDSSSDSSDSLDNSDSSSDSSDSLDNSDSSSDSSDSLDNSDSSSDSSDSLDNSDSSSDSSDSLDNSDSSSDSSK